MEQEIINKIGELHQLYMSKKISEWTPDQLSRMVGTFAGYLYNLGAMVADANSEKEEKEIYRKYVIASEIDKQLENDVSTSQAKTTVDALESVRNAYAEEIKAIRSYNTLSYLYEDTSRIVSVLQSRLAIQRSAVFQQKETV